MLNKKLEAAFLFKNNNQPEEAMQLYEEVLASESLQSSHIDKHMFMRFNAHKNLGDVMANLKMYQESKYHFTEVSNLGLIFVGTKDSTQRPFKLDQTRRAPVRPFLRLEIGTVVLRSCDTHLPSIGQAG